MQGFCSTHVSPGPKPQRTSTGGITAGLLLTLSPPSKAQERTQLNLVCKKWRKKGYLVVDTISFVGLDKAPLFEWLQHRDRSLDPAAPMASPQACCPCGVHDQLAVCDCPTILTTGLRQGRAMQGAGSTPVPLGPKPEPSSTTCIAAGLLSVRLSR
ncbi:hypothetical protein MRX96_012383 [Rhipicephalus microplus]